MDEHFGHTGALSQRVQTGAPSDGTGQKGEHEKHNSDVPANGHSSSETMLETVQSNILSPHMWALSPWHQLVHSADLHWC